MKRTIEIILVVVGMIAYAFFALLAAVVVWIQNNQDQVTEFFADDPTFSLEEFNEMISQVGNTGWIATIALLVMVVIGIISLVFLVGNKRPRPAAIILVSFSLAGFVLLGFGAGIGGVFYLIAGLIVFFRHDDVTAI